MSDCYSTLSCYQAILKRILETGTLEEFINGFQPKKYNKYDFHEITTENTEFDEEHIFYGKRCVFTGALTFMTKSEAAQIVVDLGGICDNSVTKKTDFLVVGGGCISINKTSKQLKAEKYITDGLDIKIISEHDFLNIIDYKDMWKF